MAAIRTKKINGKSYYYLEHSFKLNGKVKKIEKYLGKEIPKDIEIIKADFLSDIYNKKWYEKLDIIKKNFLKEYEKTPKIAKDKYIESFMVKFTYNTNRIEGSKITLKETARLLEDGISPKKPLKDIKETESHKKVFYNMLEYKRDLNLNIILYWHKLLFQESEPEIAGKIRKHGVAVAGSKSEFPFPAEVGILLNDFFGWYHKNKNKLNPVELAALVHLKFVFIHPFTDGNGRISRLMMNFVLNKNRFPMLNIYYSNRNNYYNALERSQVKNIETIFVQHIIRRYLKEYSRYLK